MRALSERQAGACEHAKTPASECECRCGGKLHGSARVQSREEFERLPADDPHRLPPEVQGELGLA